MLQADTEITNEASEMVELESLPGADEEEHEAPEKEASV